MAIIGSEEAVMVSPHPGGNKATMQLLALSYPLRQGKRRINKRFEGLDKELGATITHYGHGQKTNLTQRDKTNLF